jgi:hypothetical protein
MSRRYLSLDVVLYKAQRIIGQRGYELLGYTVLSRPKKAPYLQISLTSRPHIWSPDVVLSLLDKEHRFIKRNASESSAYELQQRQQDKATLLCPLDSRRSFIHALRLHSDNQKDFSFYYKGYCSYPCFIASHFELNTLSQELPFLETPNHQ